MKRLRQHIRNYFGFSKTETNGFLVLVPLMVLLLFSPKLFALVFASEYDPNSGDRQLLDSVLLAWNGRIEKPVERPEMPRLEIKLVDFDPNGIDKEGFESLGVPTFLARRIINYREKGGSFKIKSDLKRIYDFPDSLYTQLESYIQLPDQIVPAFKKPTIVRASREVSQTKAVPVAKIEAPPLMIDLNEADTAELKKLKGIGPSYSRRIIKYRELLGGFASKAQLNEVYGISDSLFQSISGQVYTGEETLRKLNVNIANFKALNRHPYISYKQAGSILNARSKKGKFRSPLDLLVVEGLDSAHIQRLTPYITF